MYAHVRESLERICSNLRSTLPERILSIYAFGSRVRGDHSEGSDFDILVLVENRTPSLVKSIIDIFVEEEMDCGLSFDPVIKDIRSFNLEKLHHTPFYENIQREGVPL